MREKLRRNINIDQSLPLLQRAEDQVKERFLETEHRNRRNQPRHERLDQHGAQFVQMLPERKTAIQV